MFQGRSFLKEIDFTQKELMYLIGLTGHLKKLKQQNIPHEYLKNKNIALLFEKTSTRTRSAFTVAANDLGANPEFLGKDDIQLGHKESTEDTAKILGSMFDGIEFRGFEQAVVEDLAKYSGVPVWNGLTDLWHPTQMIADYFTILEHFGSLENKTLAYVGDGRNNVANSLLVTGAILGVDVHIVSPKALQAESEILTIAQNYASKSGSTILVTDDVAVGVKGADVLYTDVWVSMGEAVDFKARIDLLLPYQINAKLVAQTGNDETIILHCLPAFHDTATKTGKELAEKYGYTELEITDEIFRNEQSLVFTQGENRMHSIKAIMAATLGNLYIPDNI